MLCPLLVTLYTEHIEDIILLITWTVCSMQMILNYTLLMILLINVLPWTPFRNVFSKVIEGNTINKLLCNASKTEVIQFRSRFVKNPILVILVST